jgi:hypothetical protein
MSGITITPIEIIYGTISYLIIHGIVWVLRKVFGYGLQKTERALAIRHHYKQRALKKSHFADSGLVCKDGRCELF